MWNACLDIYLVYPGVKGEYLVLNTPIHMLHKTRKFFRFCQISGISGTSGSPTPMGNRDLISYL